MEFHRVVRPQTGLPWDNPEVRASRWGQSLDLSFQSCGHCYSQQKSGGCAGEQVSFLLNDEGV